MTSPNRFASLAALLFLAGALLFSACSSSSQTQAPPAYIEGDQYVLAFRVPSGQTFDGTMEVDNDMDMFVMGQSMAMKQAQTFFYEYNVVSMEEETGLITIEQTLRRVKGSVENDMVGAQSYDTSDEDGGGPMAEQQGAMLDVPIRFTMTPTGKVQSVDSVEDIRQRLSDNALSEAQRTMIEDMLGDGNFSSNMQTFSYFPDAPVSVGESWTTQNRVNTGMEMMMDATYTLDRVEADTAFLQVAIDTYTPDDAEVMENMGGEMTMDMTGTMTGTAVVDLPTGLIRSMDLDSQMDADATVSQGGQTFDMEMSITGKNVSTTTAPTPASDGTSDE